MSAPIVKFRTGIGRRIEQVEVLRETDQSVFMLAFDSRGVVRERREAKRCELSAYHDTWADAHQYLITRAEKDIDDAQRRLNSAANELAVVLAIQPADSARQKVLSDGGE